MKKFVVAALVLAAAALRAAASSTGTVSTAPEIATSTPAGLIAKAYGLDHLNDIAEIKFNFNVQQGGTSIERDWDWDIADNRVTYTGDNRYGVPIQHTYYRDELGSGDGQLNREVDDMFVDDQFWLLFPFHLAWNKDLKISDDGMQPTSIYPGRMRRLTVTMPSDGDKPGDVYEVYYTPDYLISEWSCRKAGAATPAFVTTWDRNAKAGPLLVSLERLGREGKLHVWFENVSVKDVNGVWHDAVPLQGAPAGRS